MILLQKKDSGKEVEVSPGDNVEVQLGGSGGTGYWWYITERDPKHLELLSEETKPASDPKLMGGPVTGVWRFSVRESGTTTLVMKYYRVWEGQERAAEEFSVVLRIK